MLVRVVFSSGFHTHVLCLRTRVTRSLFETFLIDGFHVKIENFARFSCFMGFQDLEAQLSELAEALRKRHPDSLANLIRAARPTESQELQTTGNQLDAFFFVCFSPSRSALTLVLT